MTSMHPPDHLDNRIAACLPRQGSLSHHSQRRGIGIAISPHHGQQYYGLGRHLLLVSSYLIFQR